MLFLQGGDGSYLPTLIKLSAHWRQMKETNQVKQSLRSLMVQTFWSELLSRAALVAQSEQRQKVLQDQNILDSEQTWLYLSWDAGQKKMVVDQKDGVSMSDMITLFTTVVNLTKETDMIHRFHALQALPKIQADERKWLCRGAWKISLRNPQSNALHEHLCRLARNGVLHPLRGLRNFNVRRQSTTSSRMP